MNLPTLSHLQFLILECLGTTKLSGRALRERLKEKGAHKTGPSFYQLMARLEESGFVEGEYSQKIVEGQIIKERIYRITAEGETALHQTVSFYSQHVGAFGPGGIIHV
jgi:DNA-binding PadR family transcriptional regulator